MQYTPGNPPSDPVGFQQWVMAELKKISYEVNNVKQISFVRWAALPAKYSSGVAYYFNANVVSMGSAEGLYIFIDPNWVLCS